MRSLFTVDEKELEKILTGSNIFQKSLLETPGSPSFLSLLAKDLSNILEGKPKENKTFKAGPVLVGKKSNKISTPKKKTKEINALKKLKSKIKSVGSKASPISVSPIVETVTNLEFLVGFINANLYEQIKKNMGSGSSRDVLNFRSGRLARSASVERISESRNGMITAFYTYMKNPYATFSVGGAQQFPKSRDPKLLISKSIREIAATQVQNRLRAVLV